MCIRDSTHAALCELAGHALGDAKGVHEMMHRAAHLSFKDFGGVFILLDDEIHAHEAGGEAGVLAAAADGLGKVFVAHGQAGFLLVRVHGDGDHLDRLERCLLYTSRCV